jgi:RhoGEF domain/FYVE zinc finger/SOS1/NGEF-like PH domain
LPASAYPTKRDKIAREILTTELSYVNSLRQVVETFLAPLQEEENQRLLSDADRRAIFANMPEMLQVNTMLLADLKERIGWAWSSTQRVGDVFKQFTPFLKMYRQYTEVYDGAIERYTEVTKNATSPFSVYVRAWSDSDDIKGMPLASYLIMPVQRIPRYKMLLQDLIKNTDEEHPDMEDLRLSLETMEGVARFINEAIKHAENRRRMIEAQNAFIGLPKNLIEPHRRFIRDGPLTKVCRKTDKQRHFFLFNDAIVYGDPLPTAGNAKFRFRKFILLPNLKVLSLPDDDPETVKRPRTNAFQFLSSQKSFVVYCDTLEQKNAWMEAILEVQLDQAAAAQAAAARLGGADFGAGSGSPSSASSSSNVAGELGSSLGDASQSSQQSDDDDDDNYEAPVWMQDIETDRCLACGATFSLWTRRHHCRKCGRIFCAPCSNKKATLSRKRGPERVCYECYDLVCGL